LEEVGYAIIALMISIIVRSMARPSLSRTLDSIAAQDYEDLQLVLVAASGPGHPEPPTRCGRHRLSFVPAAHRLTRPQASNAGLDASDGSWIGFLDDDDDFLPGHVSGLMAERSTAPAAGVIHSLARYVLADGNVKQSGQPFSLMQLFERNIGALSAMVIRQDAARRCRFDESFDILEDWDFVLQLARVTQFHFVPRASVECAAESGDSGAGLGTNQDETRFTDAMSRLFVKWASMRDALIDQVQALLQEASQLAQRGDFAGALARCDDALRVSPNDPWALNLMGMIHRAAGRLPDACAVQELAVAVRPQDADLVYNLALLCRDQGDLAAAARHCARALALSPDHPRARALAPTLPATYQ